MALRSRLSVLSETVQEFNLALDEKYAEGQRLIAAGDFSASIYLLGYAAEMLLKNAYFRFMGAGLTDEIGPRLATARAAGNRIIPAIPFEAYHSLRFWAMLLQAQRTVQGCSWSDINFTLEFERCPERLYNNWWAEMRYRRGLATSEEALQVLSDVGWLRTHLITLWS